MSEDMARALKSKGGMTVTIGGKECTVRPLGLQELTEVERDCVSRYKRTYLETYSQNLDLLPPERRMDIIEKKMEEVARWDVESLPPKYAHDPRRIHVTEKLKEWCRKNYEVPEKLQDDQWKRLVAVALDSTALTEETYRPLSGGYSPPKVKVAYCNWWITGSYDGMISFVWTCFRRDGVTREEVIEAVRDDMNLLVELAREIERLSGPQVGNG